ncbi:MAG: hypothetical protein M1830_006657 [Pleopsidium flavum]|nr:MAG: hypothetical protein M1830_006657 [Pleopsidium flavum]
MAAILAKFISKKILGETAKNNFGKEDPYFEHVPATDINGNPNGKTKKRRKPPPEGLSKNDAKVLTKVKRRAYKLDNSLFNFCGIRFGWSSVIGLVPAIGDVLDAFMAAMVIRSCQKVDNGLPRNIEQKMWLNLAVDFLVGLVPFLGDLADAVFRCNTKNAVLLERFLLQRAEQNRLAQGNHQQVLTETDLGPPPRYEPARPEPAMVPQETRGGGGAGWFSGFRRAPQADVERAEGIVPGQYSRRDDPRLQKERRIEHRV